MTTIDALGNGREGGSRGRRGEGGTPKFNVNCYVPPPPPRSDINTPVILPNTNYRAFQSFCLIYLNLYDQLIRKKEISCLDNVLVQAV